MSVCLCMCACECGHAWVCACIGGIWVCVHASFFKSKCFVQYGQYRSKIFYFFYETPHVKLCNTHTHLSICLWSFSERNGQQLVDTCNAVCNCSPDEYLPVCGSDGVMYYSACFAGCSDIIREDSIIKVSSLHMWSFIKVFHLCLELLHMACLAVFFPSWINTAKGITDHRIHKFFPPFSCSLLTSSTKKQLMTWSVTYLTSLNGCLQNISFLCFSYRHHF